MTTENERPLIQRMLFATDFSTCAQQAEHYVALLAAGADRFSGLYIRCSRIWNSDRQSRTSAIDRLP